MKEKEVYKKISNLFEAGEDKLIIELIKGMDISTYDFFKIGFMKGYLNPLNLGLNGGSKDNFLLNVFPKLINSPSNFYQFYREKINLDKLFLGYNLFVSCDLINIKIDFSINEFTSFPFSLTYNFDKFNIILKSSENLTPLNNYTKKFLGLMKRIQEVIEDETLVQQFRESLPNFDSYRDYKHFLIDMYAAHKSVEV